MILVDSDVFLDIALNRQPFKNESAEVLKLAIQGEIKIGSTALIFANIFYIITKSKDREAASNFLNNAFTFCSFLPNTQADFSNGLSSAFLDKEDAFNYFSAKRNDVEMIITRNLKDFKYAEIPVMTPSQFLLSRRYSK